MLLCEDPFRISNHIMKPVNTRMHGLGKLRSTNMTAARQPGNSAMNMCVARGLVGVALLGVASGIQHLRADVTLPKVVDSHMVLQRDRALPIWGWADPGEEVTVKLDGATATAKADEQGNWKIVLPAVKADGKAHGMSISGKNTIELEDLLIGDVWVGSGQSNMEFGLAAVHNANEALPAATDAMIRLFKVDVVLVDKVAKDVKSAGWQACSPQTVAKFPGVLYFFGQRMRKELDVPVGLIGSALGGSPIEPWTVAEGGGAVLYNGMIAPVKPFAIRGAIWYQGEANVPIGMNYNGKMNSLVAGWRKEWGYDFPFYFVQIAPWSGYGPGALPTFWEAQAASLKIRATGMVVTTDLVDDIKDIHPKNKFDVGNRLALWSLAKDFNKDLVYSGPLYKSMKIEGDKIRLTFAHIGGGLKSRTDQPLNEFEIAGADAKFVAAAATIDGDTVLVQSKDVASPTQARLGWRNEANPNLVNLAGLPAAPFQTNNWQGGTGE